MNAVPAPDPGPDAGAVWHYGDPLGEQRAAETDAVLVDRSHRAVLTLTGKDRQTWLHSISTQHVSELPEGASTQNLSLDGQGRVEDHWIQTELGGTTYLDTEPWRGEPLLEYLRKMVFWSEVTPSGVDLAVLSLLGPRLADRAVLDALGLDALPAESTAVPVAGAGFVRRMPGAPDGQIELDLLVPRVRGPPGGGAAPATRRRHRRTHDPARGGVDRWSRRGGRAPGQGLLSRAGDRRAGAQPG
jgi:tRNA-modifying protein YgfZ